MIVYLFWSLDESNVKSILQSLAFLKSFNVNISKSFPIAQLNVKLQN